MRYLILSILFMTFSVAAQHGKVSQQKNLANLDHFVTSALDSLKSVPGMVLAVVDRDGVIFQQAYGVCDVDTQRPVTLETPFYLASSTKSFTALAAAILAEEGQLNLDMSLAEALPGVQLTAPLEADKITIRDLLSHQSRLQNTAIVYRTAYTGEHTPQLLRELLNASTAGEPGFEYSNLGYVITGLIFQEKTGRDWKSVVKEKVFEPLNMMHTYANTSEMDSTRMAMPHVYTSSGSQRVRLLKNDATLHPAGGHFSTIGDLSRWVRVQLGNGSLDGQQIFPASVIAETHRKQAETDRNFYRFHRYGYGLGWYLSSFAGEEMIHHFGSFVGYRAHVSFMPEHNIGVIAMINDLAPSSIYVPDLIAGYVYEQFLGKDSVGIRYQNAITEMREKGQRITARMMQQSEQAEIIPLSESAYYRGTFVSPQMGKMIIEADGDKLIALLGQLKSPMSSGEEAHQVRVELIPYNGQNIGFTGNKSKADGLQYRGYFFSRVDE